MEKAIKITTANRHRIDDVIDEAEGRAYARCATSADVQHAVKLAEKRLQGLPKRLWLGATVTWCQHVLPNSYGYPADATHVYLERRASGWFFTGATREPAKTGSYGAGPGRLIVTIRHSDDLLEAFLNHSNLNVARGSESDT